MNRLYSYILKNDNGSAPNPFWGTCTLTICKPAIRRTAKIGDWILGTGSKHSKLKDGKSHDLAGSLVYAMKIEAKMTLADYDKFCQRNLPEKIPDWRSPDWRKKLGDSMYDYSKGGEPAIRMAVHKEKNKVKDLSGLYALLSNHFYYFGEEPRPIPAVLKKTVKKNQGHLVIIDVNLIQQFEKWIKKFKKNKIYADPQGKYRFDRSADKIESGVKQPRKRKPSRKSECLDFCQDRRSSVASAESLQSGIDLKETK